jgi:hypothetical protein
MGSAGDAPGPGNGAGRARARCGAGLGGWFCVARGRTRTLRGEK